MMKSVRQINTAGNSTYKKLAVQWLNEALCFISSLVVAESFVICIKISDKNPAHCKSAKHSR